MSLSAGRPRRRGEPAWSDDDAALASARRGLCISCHKLKAAAPDYADPPLWCVACWAECEKDDDRLDAANKEVRRHGYADRISLYLFRIIRELIMDGSLPDASLETLRSHDATWWLGCYDVGKVRLAELERLMRTDA